MDDKSNLPIISTNNTDIENLDTDKLRIEQLKSFYTIQTALFSQAGFEFSRLQSGRVLIKKLEEELLKVENLEELNPAEKLRLYSTLLTNQNFSLEFLHKLHNSIASGIEVVNQIEKLKSSTQPKKNISSKESNADLIKIKAMLREKIKEKINESNQ